MPIILYLLLQNWFIWLCMMFVWRQCSKQTKDQNYCRVGEETVKELICLKKWKYEKTAKVRPVGNQVGLRPERAESFGRWKMLYKIQKWEQAYGGLKQSTMVSEEPLAPTFKKLKRENNRTAERAILLTSSNIHCVGCWLEWWMGWQDWKWRAESSRRRAARMSNQN